MPASIYNEFLVPRNPLYLSIEDRFYKAVQPLMKEALDNGLNPREVSHELIRTITAIEADLVITRYALANRRYPHRVPSKIRAPHENCPACENTGLIGGPFKEGRRCDKCDWFLQHYESCGNCDVDSLIPPGKDPNDCVVCEGYQFVPK